MVSAYGHYKSAKIRRTSTISLQQSLVVRSGLSRALFFTLN